MARRLELARLPASIAALLALAACSMAPTYRVPLVALPSVYPGQGIWQAAVPADELPREGWWKAYGSAVLDRLENRLLTGSPDLAAALARYDGAAAFAGESRSSLFPRVGAGASTEHARQSDDRPLRGSNQPNEYDGKTVGLQADYELDLWSRVRNEVVAGRADTDAAAADLSNVRLSLQAELAELYVRSQGEDTQARILGDTIVDYEQALTLTTHRFHGGVSSGLDVSRATAQLADARAQLADVQAQRELIQHAIDRLTGEVTDDAAPASGGDIRLPQLPTGVPSLLLQRRPDIAAAERRMFAANRRMGVAKAAFFPSVTLGAGYGWQDAGGTSLLGAANRFWALGPAAVLTLFDGGLRHQREKEAQATIDETAADYRRTVLTSFQQVRDNLSLLRHLADEAMQEEAAATAASQAQDIATHRYTEGTVSFLDVVDAQSTALNAQRRSEQVRTRRLEASIELIRALGGGWSTADLSASRAGPPAMGAAP